MSELRYDSIRRHWVIIAGDRSKRPSDFRMQIASRSKDECPFCPGNESETPSAIWEFPNGQKHDSEWEMRLIPNRFPALAESVTDVEIPFQLYNALPARGVHEVLIESREHGKRMSEYSVAHLAQVLSVYRDRIRIHSKERSYPYIAIFRNVGFRGGASLNHPHSQILAMPVIPPALTTELESAADYFEENRRCIFCDLISVEIERQARLVYEDDHFVVLTPFASRFAFELQILPKFHAPDFSSSESDILDKTARILRQLANVVDSELDSPDHNLILHSVPNLPDGGFHWHFEVLPRLAFQAGFEWGTGIHIVSVPPEEAARRLRDCWGKGSK